MVIKLNNAWAAESSNFWEDILLGVNRVQQKCPKVAEEVEGRRIFQAVSNSIVGELRLNTITTSAYSDFSSSAVTCPHIYYADGHVCMLIVASEGRENCEP